MRCLFAALGLLGLSIPALAADYDLPTLRGTETTFVPAFPTYFNWRGFYFGGHVAYVSGNSDFSQAAQPLVAFALRNSTVLAEMMPDQWQLLGVGSTGAAGFGGFIGYNYQWDSAVIGLELNYTHTSLNNNAPDNPITREQSVDGLNDVVTLDGSGSVNITDFITTRARFGWVVDNFMPYATLGLAFGRADMSVSTVTTVTEIDPSTKQVVGQFSFPQSQSKNGNYIYGYAGGGGLEFALTQNIFARGEYEYIQWQRIWSINSATHNVRGGLGVKF